MPSAYIYKWPEQIFESLSVHRKSEKSLAALRITNGTSCEPRYDKVIRCTRKDNYMRDKQRRARRALNDRFGITIRVREIESAIGYICTRQSFFRAINDRER